MITQAEDNMQDWVMALWVIGSLAAWKSEKQESEAHIVFLAFQIYLRFLEYQMENSNECKKNFVAVYDGSSAIEDLKVTKRPTDLLWLPHLSDQRLSAAVLETRSNCPTDPGVGETTHQARRGGSKEMCGFFAGQVL